MVKETNEKTGQRPLFSRLANFSSSSDQQTIERARYKLRQAEITLQYLRQVPAEIAEELRRARPISEPDPRLDTFFFSFLGLAKSAYYIVKSAEDGRYKDAIHSWRMNVLDNRGRTQFNRMMKLRDIDVHQRKSDGKALATLIPIERGRDSGWIYQQQPNYAVFGISRPVTTHKNPDGSTVSSYEGLQGSMALYVEIAGEICEASNACERLLTQLNQLVDAVSVANLPQLSWFQLLWLWARTKLRLRD